MEIPVFDIKSEASGASPFKPVEGTGKAVVEDFTEIFNGCVSDCSEAGEGSGAKTVKTAVTTKSVGQTVLAEPAALNVAALKEAVAADDEQKSPVISENGVIAEPAESLVFSRAALKAPAESDGSIKSDVTTEPMAFNPTSLKITLDSENSVLTEKSVLTRSEKPLTVKEDLFRGDTGTVKALQQDLTASTNETVVESAGSTKTAVVAEQIKVSTPVQSSTSKTDKTQKHAKPAVSRALKNNEKQADSVITVPTSIDKPAKKAEVKEAQDKNSAKESKSEEVTEDKTVQTNTGKLEGDASSPTLLSRQSQSDAVPALQASEKQATAVIKASQVNAQLNTGIEKAPERPIGASDEKASEVSVTTAADAKTHSTVKADSLPAPEVLTAASDKTADIKTSKALSNSDLKDPYSDNATPEGLNACGDDLTDKKITVKTEANTPVIKKTEPSSSALPSGDPIHSAASESAADTVEAKGTPVKAVQEHQTSPFAGRLRADNPVAVGSNVQTVAEKQATTIPVTAASVSEGFEKQDEREGTGNDSRKESLFKIENTAGTLHSGTDVRSSRFSSVAAGTKQAETVRAEVVFEKLDTGVKMSLGKGGKEVSLSLSPEHLGQLHIKLNVDESTVKARIVVDSDAAKAILDNDSGRLKEAFSRQGLTLDKYTIELSTGSNPSGGGSFTENGAGENTFGRTSSCARSGARDEETAGTKAYVQTENIRRSTGGVDLFA